MIVFEVMYDLSVSTHEVNPMVFEDFERVEYTYPWTRFPENAGIIVVNHDADQIKTMCDKGNLVYSADHNVPIKGLSHHSYLEYTIYETEIKV